MGIQWSWSPANHAAVTVAFKYGLAKRVAVQEYIWFHGRKCAWQDLNLHPLRDYILSVAWLPITPQARKSSGSGHVDAA